MADEGASPPPPLVADELVDDRALRAVDDDAFRLTDFAQELVALCESTSLPANIALFAPWGSGKSSLANLLEAKFKQSETVAFATFNAFKYGEVPLRRHFLSQVAAAFGVKGPKYREELYKQTQSNTYKFPPRELSKFLLLVAAVTGVVFLLLVAVSVLVAATAKGPFWPDFSQAVRRGIPAVMLGSGLLSAIFALAGQKFSSVSTRQAPSTEEEFERLFKDLVHDIQKTTDCSRIVIFIDELDRCSPEQVVTALETIRTFLDIPPCIFIVAADQQAVEQALKEEARQATPIDPSNPYYGAGTAYLDKIFQYQLALPPLLPRTLSQFALSLIETRPGIWQEIDNKPELITVLVPEHVRSPRRVKVLLNAFVLSFRLALRRAGEGALDANVRFRASEVAKVVCLRTEFPLFDLRIDSRMPQATLALYRNSDLTLADLGLMGFSEEAFARAEAYANGELPLYETIARRVRRSASADANDERSGEDKSVGDDEVAAEDADEQQDELDEEESSSDDIDASLADPSDVIKSQARQLIAYLQRTEEIPGPARDLIYLESAGAALGLSPELADDLERNALNGAVDAVVESVGQLDELEQESAYRLLAHLVRERFGLEANNARTCLLQALAVAKGSLDSIVDDVLTTLRVATSGYALRTADLPGALQLSLLRNSEAATELRRQVLTREETRTDEALGLLVLSRAHELTLAERKQLGPILAQRIAETDVEPLFEAISDLEAPMIANLISAHEQQIREEFDAEESEERFSELASYAVGHRVEPRSDVLDAPASSRLQGSS